MSIHLFYIAQESINNALKHGNAKNISLLLNKENSRIYMKIENDFGYREKKKESTRGIGIEIMKYRANLIGANLDIIEDKNKFIVELILD